MATTEPCSADMARAAGDPQARHHCLTPPPCIGLGAAAGEASVRPGLTAASILAGVGGAGARWDALVGVPLVDAHQLAPARTAGTDIGATAANLNRGVCFGEGGEAVLAGEGEALLTVLDVGNAAVEA